MIQSEYLVRHGENTIYGTLYLPEGEGKFPAIILSHGYNGIGKDFERECVFFAQNGYVAYAHDFCGGSVRSRSTGKSTDMTVFTEKEDLLCVFEEISALPFVDRDNVFLFGGSQGGFVSTLAAEELGKRVRALALYYPAYCIPDNWRQTYPTLDDIPKETSLWGMTLGRKFFECIHDFYTFDNLGRYGGRILIIHGDRDAIVPTEYSQKLQGIYDDVRLVVLPNEDHGFTPEGGQIAMQLVLAFMEQERSDGEERKEMPV